MSRDESADSAATRTAGSAPSAAASAPATTQDAPTSESISASDGASAQEAPTTAPADPPRRRRRYRQRLTLTYRPVYPIRALWLQASEEERKLAHERTTAILEYWVGIVSKKESAERLNVPPIRLWQMSQRAVSGMACALLKPPKTLPRRGSGPQDQGPRGIEATESSPVALRKEIARLKRDLEQRNNLIEVLKSLPSNRLPTRSEKAAEAPKAAASSGRAEHAAEAGERPRGRKRRGSPPPEEGREEPAKTPPEAG